MDIQNVIEKLGGYKLILERNDNNYTREKYAEIRPVTEKYARQFLPENQQLSDYLNNAFNYPDAMNWGNSRVALLMALNLLIEFLNSRTTSTPYSLSSLHPLVNEVAGHLFKDGHYREAILNTYILLVKKVQAKSGLNDLDNSKLMQRAFSSDNPILRVSENADERLGFMWLYTGAVMGIRNPKAHDLIEQKDPQRAFEWLAFASVLLRVLDDATVVK